MAASLSDQYVLSGDATFIGRVRQAMITACINIKSEPVGTAFHRERESFLVAVMNSPDTYKSLFANGVATDAGVISDATSAGTIVLTSANVAARAALVLDADIANAIGGQFNSFFRTPGN